MPDIFDEVEEDLRAERARQIWLRYGGVLVSLLVLVLLAVAGWQAWRWHQNRLAMRAAGAYLAAHNATEAEGADLKAMADRFVEIGNDSPAGYRTLARLRAAALKAEVGERDAALALYDQVANDGAADPLYRELANLMWVLRSLDTADPAQLEARLAPLARPEGPWRYSAQELSGLVALRRGDKEAAKRTFQALVQDVTAPQGIRSRAQRLAAEVEG